MRRVKEGEKKTINDLITQFNINDLITMGGGEGKWETKNTIIFLQALEACLVN